MPKTSRRDFLRWTLAGSGLLLAGAASVLEPAPARAVTRLGAPTQQTALFMGTMVSITVACPSSTQAHDAMDLAFAEGRRLEALLTRHDAAAPLGVLNSQGSLRDVPPELLNVWQRAHGICHLTGGAFDATVLPLVRLLESRSNPEGELELPESDLREALALVDTEAVYAGRDGMRLERQGMGLTLDGIAKGHIVDAMSAVLLRAGCENHLINAGGDILARGHKAPGVFWRVAVEDPEKRGHYPQVLELYNQAIATSGGYEMHYDAEGRHHHLLDPSTGRSPVLGSMSVLAATCMQADALATGLSVLPAGEALTLADSLSGCACGLLRRDGRLQVSRRWPAVRLLLCPVNVQGFEAAKEIAAAIDRLDKSGEVDTIIVARGGGSREDLWVFNAEIIARAAYRCKTPLISAIGHEIDFTILDFVADQRAPTPSAAAELAVPDRAELARKLYNLEQNIQNIMQNQLKICYNELMQAEQTLSPEAVRTPLTARRQSLAARQEQLQQAMQQKLRNKKEQLGHAAALAGSLSPYQVLARGYAMLYDKNKKLCTADSLRAGDTVTVRGAAKLAHCTVISVEEQDESTQNL